MSTARVWLITGASSGFGLELARYALAQGDKVVATLRNPAALTDFAAAYSTSQLLVTRLDVTQPEEVKDAFRRTKAAFGRVDVVFSNAGFSVAGEVEGTPDEAARAMFEVDFWGAADVSREAVRFFREENVPQGGHLLQTTSGTAVMGMPFVGYYSAAKHALEGLTEALWKEVNPAWNIKITSVLPGAFATGITSRMYLAPQHVAYAYEGSVTGSIRKIFEDHQGGGSGGGVAFNDAAKGVQKIFALTRLENPPNRFALGKDSIGYIREHIGDLTKDVEAYETWSEGLLYKGD